MAGAAGLEPVTSAVTAIRPAHQSVIPIIGILFRNLLSMKQFAVLLRIWPEASATSNLPRPPNSTAPRFSKNLSVMSVKLAGFSTLKTALT